MPPGTRSRLDGAPPSSFDRLGQLLKGVTPNFTVGNGPVLMTLGEPQDAPPAFVVDTLARHARDFGRYPPIAATEKFRAACAAWLRGRFSLPADAIDPESQILPLNGTREGLFHTLFPLMPESKAGGRPVVLIPNPFYGVYPSAAIAAGAEPYYVSSRSQSGFLPDFASVPRDVLARTVAAFFCSPSNPQSTVAGEDTWRALFALADTHDFIVLADECYADIYDRAPPTGALTVRHAMSGNCDRLIGFHSLSKRSNLPGLRSGFMVGPQKLMAPLRAFRNLAAPQVPLPVIEASIAAWSDETHVEQYRARYRKRFAVAEKHLGRHHGFQRPAGGFYLWLEVGDGAGFARRLWQDTGIRVMPGAFMGVEEISGKTASNPGARHVRIALVHDLVTIGAALERMADFLDGWDTSSNEPRSGE